MNFLRFYRENVSSNIDKGLVNTLTQMSVEMNKNLMKKCYMFSIAPNKHLMSHQHTHAKTALEVLREKHTVILVTKLKPFVKIILKQIQAQEKVTVTENKEYTIIKLA